MKTVPTEDLSPKAKPQRRPAWCRSTLRLWNGDPRCSALARAPLHLSRTRNQTHPECDRRSLNRCDNWAQSPFHAKGGRVKHLSVTSAFGSSIAGNVTLDK